MELEDLITIRQTPAKKKRAARRGKIVYLFHVRRSGWLADLPIYLFQCPNEECVNHDRLAIDYPHGYENYNQRLNCPDCRTPKYFPISWKFHLAQLWQLVKLARKLRKGKFLADN